MSAPETVTGLAARAWLIYLALMAVVTAAYLGGPTSLSDPLYILIGASAAAALIVGARLHQPGNRLPWVLFAAGQALFIVGDLVMFNYESLFDELPPYPSVADGFYFAFYPLVVAGVLLLIRQRYLTPDRASLIDALMVTVAVAGLSWTFLMAPYAQDASLTLPMKFTLLAYPAMDILLLGVVVRLAVGGGYRGPSFVMFSIAVVGLLLIDALYGWHLLHTRYETGTVLESGWALIGVPDEKALFYLLFGAAALHPSMRNLGGRTADPDMRLTPARLTVLAAAILAAPAVVIVRSSLGLRVDVKVLTATSVVMFGLVMIRMAGLVRRNEEVRAREVALRTAGEALVTATTRGQISSAAAVAARAVVAQEAHVRLYLPGGPGPLVVAAATDAPCGDLPGVPRERLLPLTWATLGARRVVHLQGPDRLIPSPPEGAPIEYVAPLFARDELMGLLVVFPPTALSPAVLESLEALTTQVALALESAALAEDVLKQHSEARLTALVERASDVIWVIGADSSVHYVSPSASRVLGRSPDSMIGAYLDDLLDQGTSDSLVAFVDEVAALPPIATATTEARLRHRDGTWLDLEVTGTNLIDDPSVEGIVLNIRDVTERTRTQRELVTAHAKAVEASRLKSEFVANMSHEIRTPLNAVIGLSGLLRDTELDAGQAEYVEGVQGSAETLMTLVEDILDFSKIEAGTLELEEHEFDPRAIVHDVHTGIAPSAQEKGLELAVWIDADVPARVEGDDTRIRQVLANLMTNAVKFTPLGQVSLRVSTSADPVSTGDRAVLRFEVTDTGIGLQPEAFEHIFDSFSQADGSMTRRYGGTGLGLAISKRLVELMGGAIGGESTPSEGSTFWFQSPVRVLAAVQPEARPAEPDVALEPRDAEAASCRVLLVEDNRVNQIVAARLLEKRGMEVDVASDGIEALERYAERSYDLIVMDCQMPRLDGYAATRRIREREGSGPRTPIVALTAHAMKGDRERCLGAGMDDYLTKPVRPAELDEVIARFTSRRRTAGSLVPAPAVSREAAPPALPVFDPSVLDGLGDEEVRSSLIEMFREQAQDHIAQLGEAVTGEDLERVGRVAHSLKGSAAVIGAVRLSDLADRLCRSAAGGCPKKAVALLADLEAGFRLTSDALAAPR